MDIISYNSFEQKLIKNESLSFVKMLIERDIKNYKYNINDESIVDYVHRFENEKLYNVVQKYSISDSDLNDIRDSIIKTSNYNLEVEYLPTEDWEFETVSNLKELVIELPNYEMLSNGLALLILILPFGALFLSYFLIMIFR